MKSLVAWFRECCRLQTVSPCTWINLTTFGRARLMTEAHPLDDREPPYYMLYWLRLPIFDYDFHFDYMSKCGLAQAVLFFHGKHGFSIRYERPLQS